MGILSSAEDAPDTRRNYNSNSSYYSNGNYGNDQNKTINNSGSKGNSAQSTVSYNKSPYPKHHSLYPNESKLKTNINNINSGNNANSNYSNKGSVTTTSKDNPSNNINSYHCNSISQNNHQTFTYVRPKEPEKIIEALSYYKLKELSDKPTIDIINYISKIKEQNKAFADSIIEIKLIYIMISSLDKVIKDNTNESNKLISDIIRQSSFFKVTIKNHLCQLETGEFSTEVLEFLDDTISFFVQTMEKFADLHTYLPLILIAPIAGVIKKLEDYLIDSSETNQLVKGIVKNNEKLQILIIDQFAKEINDRKLMKLKNVPFDYYKSPRELTSNDFIMDTLPIILPHLKEGNYLSWEKYLNTLFYLEKEDCYRSLRSSINKILNGQIELEKIEKNFRDIYYYYNVEIQSIDITKNGFFLVLDFEPIKSNVTFTKRMIYGSLLVLADMEFSDCMFTTVQENPYVNEKLKLKKDLLIKNLPKKQGRFRIAVSLVSISAESFNFLKNNMNKSLQIFESKAYFESYVHVMKRLQDIRIKDLPFEDVIIKADFTKITPKYHRELTYEKKLSINLNQNKFPPKLIDELDSSQLEALALSLKNKVAIIQGPPGTGKTHAGSLMVKILLENRVNKSPILIVCFTNHALDQFLEHLLDYTDNMIRIGGRCNNERLKQYGLNRKSIKRDRYFYDIQNRMEDIGVELKEITNLINYKKKLSLNKVRTYFPTVYKKMKEDFYKKTGLKKTKTKAKNIHKDLYLTWIEVHDFEYFYKEIIQGKDKEYKYYWDLFDQFYTMQKSTLFPDDMRVAPNPFQVNTTYKNMNNQITQLRQIYNQKQEEIDEYDDEEIEENLNRMGDIDDCEYSEELDDFYSNNKQKEKKEKIEDYDLKDQDDKDNYNVTNYTDKQFEYIINKHNLWDLGSDTRKNIMSYMRKLIIGQIDGNFPLLKEYNELYEKKEEIRLMSDSQIIKQADVVGMTTTGASKYSTILENSQFEIVVIEEAAEVLESHIASLLTKNTKQLIMIGDHKQLRPKPYNYEIATDYNFDISMFERLINNKIPFASLKFQRRMKPIFADFMRIIYKDGYDDHITTTEKPPVRGFLTDMHIFNHTSLETDNIGLASKSNEFEARYLIKLAKYITQQGYPAEKITILTFYIGQVIMLRSMAKESKVSAKIVSVDSYQGEENDFILLSLVRSNKQNIIGFLKTFNRVCVAFSRAKIGFYIVGNIDCLIRGEHQKFDKNKDNEMKDIWKKIKVLAIEKQIIDDKIVLACQRHKNQTVISTIADFAKVPDGGCKETCEEELPCGHICNLLCHGYSHETIKCFKPCSHIFPLCQHKCTKICHEPCQCLVKVTKILPCNHKVVCYCYEDIKFIKCMEKCERKLSCGHPCKAQCYETCSDYVCNEKVSKTLPCGHSSTFECHIRLEKCVCKEKCASVLPCGHICEGSCGLCLNKTLHVLCKSKCNKSMICGHQCQKKCYQYCNCKEKCLNVCSHGYCSKKCGEVCNDCTKNCNNECLHGKCANKCSENCNNSRCNERCEMLLKCGHRCIGLCGETCLKKCKICDLNDDCFKKNLGYANSVNDIYYQLKKCGHIFEIGDIDHYMDNRKKINIPTCPRCNTLILNERRYSNIIKQTFKDLQSIKTAISDELYSNKYQSQSNDIIIKILNKMSEGKYASQNSNISYRDNHYNYQYRHQKLPSHLTELVPITYEICKKYINKKDEDISDAVYYKIVTLLDKFVAIEYYANMTLNQGNRSILFLINFFQLKNYFQYLTEFNDQFLEQFELKINSMYSFTIISEKSTELKNIFIKEYLSSQIALEHTIYNYQVNLNDISVKISKGLNGRWYKCTRGHYYELECDDNQKDSNACPECKLLNTHNGVYNRSYY